MVISSSVTVDLPSSSEINPSRPTLSIAEAINEPTSVSFPAEIVATFVMSEICSIGLAYSVTFLTTNLGLSGLVLRSIISIRQKISD